MTKGNYLGSPALAMNVLEKQAKRFVFFDLEKSALENVGTYAKQVGLSASVEIFGQLYCIQSGKGRYQGLHRCRAYYEFNKKRQYIM